jgi:light-regulated signal transduction histidine kinase (bacteriophytochrome)
VDLNEVIAEARQTVTAGAEARAIDWKIGPMPVVQGDAALLMLACVNLLSNAVKYTRKQDQPRISVSASWHPHNGHSIEFRDNGVGFDMAHAAKLFRPFERLHSVNEFEGTGMGLANVQRIVEKHGGTIKAQARPGEGAVFTLVLR